jgi:hypothetical protein
MNKEQNSNETPNSALNIADVVCCFYIKFKKGSSTTNDNGRWWITMDWAWCKKRGSIVVLQGKIGNGNTGDRACRCKNKCSEKVI